MIVLNADCGMHACGIRKPTDPTPLGAAAKESHPLPRVAPIIAPLGAVRRSVDPARSAPGGGHRNLRGVEVGLQNSPELQKKAPFTFQPSGCAGGCFFNSTDILFDEMFGWLLTDFLG